MGVRNAYIVILLLAGMAGTASAGKVDWKKGVVAGKGVAVADLASPNAKIARIRSSRLAKDRAEADALETALALPWVDGKSVDKHLSDEGRARLQSLISSDITTYTSDGGSTAKATIALESIRVAVKGVKPVSKIEAAKPLIVIVKTKNKVDKKLGWAVSPQVWQHGRYEGPVLFGWPSKAVLESATIIETELTGTHDGLLQTGITSAILNKISSSHATTYIVRSKR